MTEKFVNSEVFFYAPGEVFMVKATHTAAMALITSLDTFTQIPGFNANRVISISQGNTRFAFPLVSHRKATYDISKVDANLITDINRVLAVLVYRTGSIDLDDSGIPVIPARTFSLFTEWWNEMHEGLSVPDFLKSGSKKTS